MILTSMLRYNVIRILTPAVCLELCAIQWFKITHISADETVAPVVRVSYKYNKELGVESTKPTFLPTCSSTNFVLSV
jgi:hypothetical protein